MLTKVEFDIATMLRVMAAVPAYVPGLRVGLDLFYKRFCRTQRYVRTFFERTLLSLWGLLIDIYNGEFHVLLRYEGGPHALFVANLASGPFHGLCLGDGDSLDVARAVVQTMAIAVGMVTFGLGTCTDIYIGVLHGLCMQAAVHGLCRHAHEHRCQ
jgi:hypothetical protein